MKKITEWIHKRKKRFLIGILVGLGVLLLIGIASKCNEAEASPFVLPITLMIRQS